MRTHITYHLQRLALFALPDVEQGGHAEELSGHSGDSIRAVQRQGSRRSIGDDYSQDENPSFAQPSEPGETGDRNPSMLLTEQAIRELLSQLGAVEGQGELQQVVSRWRQHVHETFQNPAPIKFKDVLGRQLSFDFPICESWEVRIPIVHDFIILAMS